MVAQDLIRVVFYDMDPTWLKSMWDDRGTIQADRSRLLSPWHYPRLGVNLSILFLDINILMIGL